MFIDENETNKGGAFSKTSTAGSATQMIYPQTHPTSYTAEIPRAIRQMQNLCLNSAEGWPKPKV
ncbi:uncharacterized protein Bfra_002482 [Botrytis fragariae]|uniref:Uncharacterized protein n=1 Tax=Botrytis fragariae TaxID=1964551 RepID=A0A8H6AYE6_9HELO|nr:uncharacterized protein Bfra_002482 [Botrytis fragariae]KAF5876083.1 hypothetical protein Bfra_002482 [Botrytis fragariae]